MVALENQQTAFRLPPRFVLLGLVGAAVLAATQLIWLCVQLVFGDAPDWIWYAILAVQGLPALLLAGAMLVSGSSDHAGVAQPPADLVV